MHVFLSLVTEVAISLVLNAAFGYVNACGQNITAASAVVSFTDNFTNPRMLVSQYVLAVPQLLNGMSLLLVFLTALEFILAQAPVAWRKDC